MTVSKLQEDLTVSLKAGKTERVETLRFLISAVRNAAIAKYGNRWETSLTDVDIVDVVKKQVKTHRESIEAFQKGGRKDLVDKETAQLAILEEFMPKELTDEALKALLIPVAASGESNFGLLMKAAMAAVGGQADGARVSGVLRSLLPK